MLGESLGDVLAAPVRMEDRPSFPKRAVADRHVDRLADQAGVHVVGHRIAGHLLGAAVQDCGQTGEPLPGSDVGDMSTHVVPGLSAVKLRSIGSGRESRSASGTVVRTFARGWAASRPRTPTRRLTVPGYAWTPLRARAAWTLR
jgi:hypothetical protein